MRTAAMSRAAWTSIAVSALVAALFTSAASVGAPATTLVLDHVEFNNKEAATYLGEPGWKGGLLNKGSTTSTFEYAEKEVKGQYNWTVPKVIPPAGADLKLRATATDKTGYRMYAYIGVSGTYGAVKGGTSKIEIQAEADKNAGKTTAIVNKTFRIFPATVAANGIVSLKVDLGPEGPSITYFYKAAAAATSKCSAARKTSMVRRAQDDPKCTFVVTYRFRFVGEVGNVAIEGHGKLKGTSAKHLEPQEIASDDDENLIRWRDGSQSMVLDVKTVHYSNTAKTGRELAFAVTVFRSNVPACPKGKQLVLFVTDDGELLLPECGIDQPHAASTPTKIDVDVKTD